MGLTVEEVRNIYRYLWETSHRPTQDSVLRGLKQAEAALHLSEKWERNPETGRYELVALVSLAGRSLGGA
jgi:hypothetical protein